MSFYSDDTGSYSYDVHEIGVGRTVTHTTGRFYVYVDGKQLYGVQSLRFEEMRDAAGDMRSRDIPSAEVRFVENSCCLPTWWSRSVVVPLDTEVRENSTGTFRDTWVDLPTHFNLFAGRYPAKPKGALTMSGVVGYSYQAETLCPTCTLKAMRANGIKVQKGKPHEGAIRRAAQNLGIDFDDEHSYDSGDFPTPVTEQQCETELTEVPSDKTGTRHAISDERCTGDGCGKWLVLGEKSPSEAALTRYVRDSYELPHALAKTVAGELRRWGLSHPEFIKEENARQAATMFPHDFATVDFRGNSQQVVMFPTPQADGDVCFYCEMLWEEHMFTCDTCGIDIPALTPHRHQVPTKGQCKHPLIPAP
ncbi:hypothetical protein [Streptomyces sp. NBC_00987]|uniref:hypothetical protein n=1 Tax=Streptomyces sp. NBC_00987 TaxID=2903703 RepID=UPI0038679FD3|nr:hypothetical protein OG355_41225 [Streptomyces sp. NBC_00987]